MERRTVIAALLLVFSAGMLAFARSARAAETNAVEDIVAVLQQKGLIDEATGDEILAKQERSDAKEASARPPVAAAPGLTEGFVWSGDLRLRDEQFWYGRALGADAASDNNRFRYRARLGFTKQVNSWALVGIRLSSGTGNYRSPNVSFGETTNFNNDIIFVDGQFVQYAAGSQN